MGSSMCIQLISCRKWLVTLITRKWFSSTWVCLCIFSTCSVSLFGLSILAFIKGIEFTAKLSFLKVSLMVNPLLDTRNTGRYAPLFLVLALWDKRGLGNSGPGWELCDIHTSQHWSKKNISIIHMCHMSPKRILKKIKNFEFFQKRGVRGSKSDFFEKIFPKSKRASKIGY